MNRDGLLSVRPAEEIFEAQKLGLATLAPHCKAGLLI